MNFGEADLPALYQSVNERSETAQKHVLSALKVSLGGVVIAAALGAVSIDSSPIDWSALTASVAFLAATICTAWLLWAKPEQLWYDARAAAESAKTLAWQFAVGGGEFARTDGAEDAVRARFLKRLAEMLEGLDQLGPPPDQGESQMTPGLVALRESTLSERRRTYLVGRIQDQRNWYAGKARMNESRRVAWTAATVVLLIAGVLCGLAKTFREVDVDLLGPTAAAAGSAMAWARSKDYAQLAAAYAVTAHELSLIEAQIDAATDEPTWASFVERAERAISREHTLWKARRGEPRMGP